MGKYKRHFRRKLVVLTLLLLTIGTAAGHLLYKNQVTAHSTAAKKVLLVKKEQQVKQQQNAIKQKLQVYLQKVAADGTVSVSFYNLGATAKGQASAVYAPGALATEVNGDTPQVAASTYKLFLTAYLFAQIKAGHFAWTAGTKAAFYEMIVNSRNNFAEDLLNQYGMTAINAYIGQQGWYAPVFNYDQPAMTTSHSLQRLLLDLAQGRGAFAAKTTQTELLSLMSKQKYRAGIPAGTAQALRQTKVADKVGFLADACNDAAIVTLPNGQRYILVIMTHGHGQHDLTGFSRVATIAQQVQTIVYGKV